MRQSRDSYKVKNKELLGKNKKLLVENKKLSAKLEKKESLKKKDFLAKLIVRFLGINTVKCL
jgi:hypothetical protein